MKKSKCNFTMIKEEDENESIFLGIVTAIVLIIIIVVSINIFRIDNSEYITEVKVYNDDYTELVTYSSLYDEITINHDNYIMINGNKIYYWSHVDSVKKIKKGDTN